jgi:hypothetical protein
MRDLSRPSQQASAVIAQTGVRSRFLWKRSKWKRYQQGKMGKIISEKRDGTAIPKFEGWAKSSQKVKQNHRHHFNEGHIKEKNTTMNMKMSMKMKMTTTMNAKNKMTMKKKINMNENLNLYLNVTMHVKQNGDY